MDADRRGAGGAGYWLAWKNGPDQYIVWETDGAGNFIRNMINPSSGTTSAVQQFEPFLHQDLNGDGVIPIEAFGATKLVQSATLSSIRWPHWVVRW